MTDLRDFRRTCYAAAHWIGARVVEFRLSLSVTPNFHQCLIVKEDDTVAVACLRDAPILAVAEPRVIEGDRGGDWSPLTFLEAPELVDALTQLPGFQVLTATALSGPLDRKAWPRVHRSDIRYWKPRNLGEALFNFWD